MFDKMAPERASYVRMIAFWGCLTLICLRNPSYASRLTEDAQLEAAASVPIDDKQAADIEVRILENSNGRASRNGLDLSLKILGKKPKIMKDNNSGCANGNFNDPHCFSFTLIADLPSRHAYLVEYSHYFRGSFHFIDARTGSDAVLSGMPRFGPNDAYLLAINNDQPDIVRMEIWRRTSDGLKLEWELTNEAEALDAYDIMFQSWNQDGIRLDFSGQQDHPAKLIHEIKGWKLKFDDLPSR